MTRTPDQPFAGSSEPDGEKLEVPSGPRPPLGSSGEAKPMSIPNAAGPAVRANPSAHQSDFSGWGKLWIRPLLVAVAWGAVVAVGAFSASRFDGSGPSDPNLLSIDAWRWMRWWASESMVCLAALVPWLRLPNPPEDVAEEKPWVRFWHRVLLAIVVATFVRTLGTVALVASGSYQLGEDFGTSVMVVLSTYGVVTTAEIWTTSQVARRVDRLRRR